MQSPTKRSDLNWKNLTIRKNDLFIYLFLIFTQGSLFSKEAGLPQGPDVQVTYSNNKHNR